MHTLYGTYATTERAWEAFQALLDCDVPKERLQLQAFKTPEGHLAIVAVDVSHGDLDQEMMEAVLHRYHAAKVYGASEQVPHPEELPSFTAPSTGTYELHAPVSGAENRIDVATQVLPPTEAPEQPPADEPVLLEDSSKPKGAALQDRG